MANPFRLSDETPAVMRWFWIDRFLEFESGKRAVATKNITRAEFHLDDYTPGWPTYPPSLIVEGLAQTGGLLVGEHNQFLERVVLAKIGRATFHFPATMGDQLRFETTVQNMQSDGAIVEGTSHVGDKLQAEVQLVFAHLDDRFPRELFDHADFLYMLRSFGLYGIGVDADGRPLTIPPHLLEAEVEYLKT
jgi:3-hydroxyacyl-[acyl-carrier-protein] dehydratase